MKVITAALVAALLVGANAVQLKKKFNRADCNEEMVGLNFELRTDQFPGETTIIIENEDNFIVFEWGSFTKGERVYTTDDDACPGKYTLIIEDSGGDGLGDNYGEFKVTYDKSNKVILDRILYDFGNEYTKIFKVVGGGGGSTGGTGGGSGSGVFGCGGSKTKKNCRCCKDKCKDKHGRRLREGRQLMTVKECKKHKCRSYYGKKTCKD